MIFEAWPLPHKMPSHNSSSFSAPLAKNGTGTSATYVGSWTGLVRAMNSTLCATTVTQSARHLVTHR